MIDLPDTLDLLSHRVEDLEKRVSALEHPASAAVPVTPAPRMQAAIADADAESMERTGGVFPVLGRALLGVAGAYVLRAVAESTAVPRVAIAGVAIAYAAAWLVWASRAKGAANLERAVYASTSALILAPMLWELTLHFKVLTPSATATVLAGFVTGATILAWDRKLAVVLAVANGMAAATAFALSVAAHTMAPFIAALLWMVLLCEYAVVRDRGQTIRLLVATAADISIWALMFVYAGPLEARVDYPVLTAVWLLTPAWLLFLISCSGIAVRTVAFKKTITVFDTIQTMIAFVLAAASVVLFGTPWGTTALAAVCLLLAVFSYALVFGVFRRSSQRRNFYVFGAWSAGLVAGGLLTSLPPAFSGACLGVAALAAVALGVRMQCAMLELHGLVYLVAAALATRLPEYTFEALAGTLPGRPAWDTLLVSICAVLCYAVAKEHVGETWHQQAPHFALAAIAAAAVSAMVAKGLLGAAALGITLDVFHVAFFRTLTVCALALGFAFGGSRLRRPEMTRIAYVALAFGAAKLVFEDLRHGHMEFTAGSIFLFALTLIAVPRLARMGRTAESASHSGIYQKRNI